METRKPFSVKDYSPLKHYETRDGRPVRILNVNLEGNSHSEYPVMTIVSTPIGENYFQYTIHGEFKKGRVTEADLFEVPTRIYIILVKKVPDSEWVCYATTFKSREEAENAAKELSSMETRIEEIGI